MSIKMLKSGCHEAFTELFSLVKEEEMRRIEAGRDSFLWMITPLVEQHAKLGQICSGLIEIERLARSGRLEESFVGYLRLAANLYYDANNSEDFWLVRHFLTKCVEKVTQALQRAEFTFHRSNTDQSHDENQDLGGLQKVYETLGKRYAESYYLLGHFLLETGDYKESVMHMKLLLQFIGANQKWATPTLLAYGKIRRENEG
ncbi:unnamed protein product [Protopolystoma xenopodis]|uniref:Uncharacterized protein n=1 Tax=Protopolystoma xenopodis TaxID=117903 RepID=A0A3S5AQD9_9PLAT|nr:unnamed protein product [Protopolystoma xenopodis]